MTKELYSVNGFLKWMPWTRKLGQFPQVFYMPTFVAKTTKSSLIQSVGLAVVTMRDFRGAISSKTTEQCELKVTR